MTHVGEILLTGIIIFAVVGVLMEMLGALLRVESSIKDPFQSRMMALLFIFVCTGGVILIISLIAMLDYLTH